jgi:putative transcriptional regulator
MLLLMHRDPGPGRGPLQSLGGRLRNCRFRADLAQQRVAERASVSLKTVANAEDRQNISQETLLLLLRALGRPDEMDTLLGDHGPCPAEAARPRGRQRQRASGVTARHDEEH